MEFVCVRNKKYHSAERWEGTIEVNQVQGNVIEAVVQGRGSTMTIIFGDCVNGHFLCVPDLNIGCPLAAYDDLFWNYERLSALMNPADAITILAGIAELMEGNDGECERIFYC